MTNSTPSASDSPISPAAAHFLLRPGIAFLNHGSFGACPRPVLEVYQGWQRELEAQPVEFLARRVAGLLAEARTRLGSYIGAPADDFVFVPNATHGVNIVARSLDLHPGDEVLGTSHEYGAAERTWQFICAQRGATYRSQPLALPVTDEDALIEQLWQGVTPRTRVLFLSHITSPTALIFPVARICRRAAEVGILTVVDGAHAPGQIDLDLHALGADFYTGNLHKWVCAPKSAAFLYARPERQALLAPLIVSWGWRSEAPSHSTFQDYFGWIGTADPAAYLSVPAALDFQAEYDWPRVRSDCHALAAAARSRIAALTGLPQISPDTAAWWAQMCTVPLPPCDLAEVKRRLWEEHQVEVPLVEWSGQPYIRVSIQAYNRPSDVDRLLVGLAAALASRG